MAVSKGTVLLVEDSPNFMRIYRDVMASDGYTVLEAYDGEGGWKQVISAMPDLILTDIVMPKMTGLELLEKVRGTEGTKHIPVIMFSVLGEQKDIKKALEAGANDYTVKGFHSPRQILGKIRALLLKADQEKNAVSYTLSLKEAVGESAKLQHDVGLEPGFRCPHCKTEMSLEMSPDFNKAEGHWFTAHFICPGCKKEF